MAHLYRDSFECKWDKMHGANYENLVECIEVGSCKNSNGKQGSRSEFHLQILWQGGPCLIFA